MFDRLLLKSQSENPGDSEHFRSCLNAHGLYSTLHFVLRLSPKIHRTLSETPSGIYASSNISFEQIEAFSTYLHETVHWWQHIGSTSGLILSLSRPVQAHSNFAHLKTYLREIGPKKSILQFATANTSSERISECGSTATNIIINNFKDLSFYQTISVRPDLIRTTIADDPFFENIGHSYLITYEGTLHLLANLFDPKFHFFPDPRKWKTPFRKLKDEKIVGFYRGSPIEIPPVGLWGIFEGQARFTQLQYLHFASGGQYDWDDARNSNMLGQPYIMAFEIFLKLSDSKWQKVLTRPCRTFSGSVRYDNQCWRRVSVASLKSGNIYH